MQIQINTDRHINGHEKLTEQIRGVVERTFSRLSDHITRVEIHITDENGYKSGPNDKRCVMEARLEGRRPIAVTQQAATVDQAVDGAAEKLLKLIENTIDRLHDQKIRRTDPPLPEHISPEEP